MYQVPEEWIIVTVNAENAILLIHEFEFQHPEKWDCIPESVKQVRIGQEYRNPDFFSLGDQCGQSECIHATAVYLHAGCHLWKSLRKGCRKEFQKRSRGTCWLHIHITNLNIRILFCQLESQLIHIFLYPPALVGSENYMSVLI